VKASAFCFSPTFSPTSIIRLPFPIPIFCARYFARAPLFFAAISGLISSNSPGVQSRRKQIFSSRSKPIRCAWIDDGE